MPEINKHLLENMTFEEFRDWSAADEASVILVPLGSQEIQGPVVPMGDFMLTRRIAEEVASRAGVVAAPTLPFGYAEYFRCVPGGVALSAETFRGALRDILDGFLGHGFRRLVILNGHSGNRSPIDQVVRAVRRDTGLIVPCINLWRSIPDDVWNEVHGEFGRKAFAHGGDPITSVYLHYFPRLCHPERAKLPDIPNRVAGLPVTGLSGVEFGNIEIGMPINVDDCCPDGIVNGDPTRSSAEIGEKITEYLISLCVDFVEHFRDVDPAAVQNDIRTRNP